MIKIIKANSTHKDFIQLVKKLDKELAVRDGDQHDYYHQFNAIDKIKYAMIVFEGEEAVGIGALKDYGLDTMEVKRMYVDMAYRGKGIATKILDALELWATELGTKRLILETGYANPEAVNLYRKTGYIKIENYDQYAGIENSICFEKILG